MRHTQFISFINMNLVSNSNLYLVWSKYCWYGKIYVKKIPARPSVLIDTNIIIAPRQNFCRTDNQSHFSLLGKNFRFFLELRLQLCNAHGVTLSMIAKSSVADYRATSRSDLWKKGCVSTRDFWGCVAFTYFTSLQAR